jgi:hypothetical protein
VNRTLRAAVAALALLTAVAACGGDDDGPSGSSSGADGASSGGGGSVRAGVRPADEGIDGVVAIRIESANHTTGTVDYDRHPPAGGDHNPTPAPCGFYSQAIPDEYVVHTMEHGGVWLAYRPGLSDADVQVIQKEVAANPDTIATPYDQLPEGSPLVVTAWARQLVLQEVDDPRVDQFVQRYQNASTAPEASIECPRIEDAG